MRTPISFQVSSKGVVIHLNPGMDFADIKKALNNHIKEASDFFAGVDLYINLNNRKLLIEELQDLLNIVTNYNKVNKIYFLNEEENKKTASKETVLINRTIRSGQRIKYPTNIVILGDINPGAEVIAGGDIIVLGRLRGVVHAGAKGSTLAQVVALKLEPTQLRIGSYISRPPEGEKCIDSIKPERAYIKDNNIVVEELNI